VGAHLGTMSFPAAQQNPGLQVYAFEPNVKLAAQTWGLLPNFTLLPFAVAETNGVADFYINSNEGSSSLLPFNPEGLRRWIGGHLMRVESKVQVPTIRLDSFMEWAGISTVDYLKIDTQGADLSVLRSAGERICDIKKIMLEVAVTPVPLYEGAATRAGVIAYLERYGFALKEVESQYYEQEENLTFVAQERG
jgi:FkbM family methyltransferase